MPKINKRYNPIVKNIGAYIEAKNEFKNLYSKIVDGVMMCFCRGEWVTEKVAYKIINPNSKLKKPIPKDVVKQKNDFKN